jgi:two-component system cell cycle sensor histidine kinase/response regulator CckA
VMLSVSDSGVGMDTAVAARIFEPFFTTKPKGKGTGLGLSTVYGIVKQSGGQIDVYSEPNRGTTFKIYFPVVARVVPTQNGDGLDGAGKGSETILIVEDEPGVRILAQRSLEQHGYRVLSAASAEEALELVGRGRDRIDLLLTDAVLPKMSGPELARILQAQLPPGLRVLFVSGYTDEAIVRLGLLSATEAFLQKPFGPTVLVRKIRQVLDRDVE